MYTDCTMDNNMTDGHVSIICFFYALHVSCIAIYVHIDPSLHAKEPAEWSNTKSWLWVSEYLESLLSFHGGAMLLGYGYG